MEEPSDRAIGLFVPGFFVYGTLMRGESRFATLERFGLECVVPAKARGRLLDLNSFPGMVGAGEGAEIVHGEFIRITDMAGAIAELDRIEGFRGFGVAGSLFRRKMINVELGDGASELAWAYEFAGDGEGFKQIASGDWRAHRR